MGVIEPCSNDDPAKVERVGYCAHPVFLIDFIPLRIHPTRIKPETLIKGYVHEGLTSSQIAEKLGVSKQFVLTKLRRLGIRGAVGKGRDPKNYRFKNPPYGFHVVDGKLETLKFEMKVARLIVELRDRTSMSFEAIVGELSKRNIRTRSGAQWTRSSIGCVYRRWKGKV